MKFLLRKMPRNISGRKVSKYKEDMGLYAFFSNSREDRSCSFNETAEDAEAQIDDKKDT